jgi:membrane protein required for colicin V production
MQNNTINMNWLDATLLVTIAVAAIIGICQGFSRSGFGFLALVAAFIAAAWFSPTHVKGFVITFVGVLVFGGVTAWLFGRLLKRSGPRWLDRTLGGAFGTVNAVALSVVAVLALMAYSPRALREQVADSKFVPCAMEAAHTLAAATPPELKFRVEQSYEELVHTLPANVRQALPPAEI